jgi:CRISPR-associated endonuclease/helicase Cas3
VQVFWRAFDREPPAGEKRPAREELCSVPFLELRRWIEARHGAWRWDPLDGTWVQVRPEMVVPGGVFMLRAADGGYLPERGWSPRSAEAVSVIALTPLPNEDVAEEAIDDDPLSLLGRWVPLAQHAVDARDAAAQIVEALGFTDLPRASLVRAAQAHDLGKAHEVFQRTMRAGYPGEDGTIVWAKSGGHARHNRRGFRHELASALAWLAHSAEEDRDLVAYLAAAHHGKVRLSIRALPTDQAPPGTDRLHARGVWDGDGLPAVDLGDGITMPPTVLSLAPMRLGRQNGEPSWMERAITLREQWGPFRLAYLEALVRAADVRATLRERQGRAGR